MLGCVPRRACGLIRAQTGAVLLLWLMAASVPGSALAQSANGCGSGWSVHLVPDRFPLAACEFRASCDRHDICYGRCFGMEKDSRAPHCEYLRCKEGGDLAGKAECNNNKFESLRQHAARRKLTCDSQFYTDIATTNGDRPVCRAFAAIYSRAVKWFGDGAYEGMDGLPLAPLTQEQAERSKDAIAEALRTLLPEELNELTEAVVQRKMPIDWSKELMFDPALRRLVNR